MSTIYQVTEVAIKSSLFPLTSSSISTHPPTLSILSSYYLLTLCYLIISSNIAFMEVLTIPHQDSNSVQRSSLNLIFFSYSAVVLWNPNLKFFTSSPFLSKWSLSLSSFIHFLIGLRPRHHSSSPRDHAHQYLCTCCSALDPDCPLPQCLLQGLVYKTLSKGSDSIFFIFLFPVPARVLDAEWVFSK